VPFELHATVTIVTANRVPSSRFKASPSFEAVALSERPTSRRTVHLEAGTNQALRTFARSPDVGAARGGRLRELGRKYRFGTSHTSQNY
jgi:hypothetical protein